MRPNLLAALILILFVLLALSSAAGVPLFEASDEAAHFLYAHGLAEPGKLPNIPDRATIDAAAARGDVIAQWSIESHQPPLYYALGALLISPTSRSDLTDYLRSNDLIFTWGRRDGNANQWLHPLVPPAGDTHIAIWTLRLFSLVLACGALWCIYRAAYLAVGSASFALTVMLTTASIPTFAAISASVNNDALVTLLCAAAVYWTLRVLRFGVRKYDWALIAFIVSAIALTKFTGLWVVAVIALGLWFAVRDGKVTRTQALIVLGAIALFTTLNAGWWYARNWQLYGDPLALAATQSLWGREFAVAAESGGLLAELPRVWLSFWLMIGHLHEPVWGPVWFYVTMFILCGVALAGWVFWWTPYRVFNRHSSAISALPSRAALALLALAALLPIGMLMYGTRTVDISYGRLVFPGLVGIVPLLVLGWRRLFGRFTVLLALPLLVMTASMPFTVIRPAYPALHTVDALPETAIPLNLRVTGSALTILGYEPLPRTVEHGASPPLTLYLTGGNPYNPALTLSWLSATEQQNIGQITVYPGMSPTDMLSDGLIYTAVVPTAPLFSPAQCPWDPESSHCDYSTGLIRLQLKWQTDGLTTLPTENSARAATPILLDGPLYAVLSSSANTNEPIASFGSIIELMSAEIRHEDTVLGVNMGWRINAVPPPDLALTVQVLDAGGQYVMNADGQILTYPTRLWLPNSRAYDTRQIPLPPDMLPGTYTIAVGWYTRGDLVRLPVTAANVRDNLAVIGTFDVILETP